MSNRQHPTQVLPLNENTWWDGHLTMARRGTAIVAPHDDVNPGTWGKRVPVVEVAANCQDYKRRIFRRSDGKVELAPGLVYMDDWDGKGWHTVTKQHGDLRKAPDRIAIMPGTFRPSALPEDDA